MARNRWWTAAGVGLLFAGLSLTGVRENGADDPDQPKIQGTWELVGAERNGEAATDDEIKKRPLKIVFEGEVFVPLEGEKQAPESDKGIFKLDSTKSPKQIDVTRNNEQKRDKLIGIYELSGDNLKLCILPVSGETQPERPKEIKSAGRSMVLVLKRVKK